MNWTRLTNRLKWYEQTEYALLLLTTIAAPLSWRLATVGMILLGVIGIVKAVKARRMGNPALSPTARWCCVSMMALFVVYLVSGLASDNREYGLDVAFSKVYFLVFPLLALLSDTRYLTHKHIRGLFYTLWLTLIVLFLVRAGVTIDKMIGGTPLKSLLDEKFYPEHHTYVALYLSVAMAFAATELVRLLTKNKTKTKTKTRDLIILSVGQLLLTLFAMAVNSRAGILAIILIVFATLGYLAWTTRNWRLVLAATALVAACATGLFFLQPESRHRLTKTVENVEGDARTDLNRYGLEVVKYDMEGWQWIFGLGEGDMKEHLYVRYAAHGYKGGLTGRGMRTHNQYLDTFLGTGLVGLAVLLLMLLLPLRHNRRQEQHDRLVVPSVVLPTLLILVTEMMLVRQAGIVFIAFTYYILILWKTKTSHS